MAALGVCMHKILRIVYGILKNKQAFNPDIDKLNQERPKQKQLEKQQQKTALSNKPGAIRNLTAKRQFQGDRQKRERNTLCPKVR